MHEPYDEDDGYDDDYYDYDNAYTWYFKFDVSQNPSFSKWIHDIVNNFVNPLENKSAYVFPVNSWNPNTANNKFQYLGSNYDGDQIWKSKYWVIDPINQEYKAHIASNATHFIKQPNYYKGLFDILN